MDEQQLCVSVRCLTRARHHTLVHCLHACVVCAEACSSEWHGAWAVAADVQCNDVQIPGEPVHGQCRHDAHTTIAILDRTTSLST